MGETKWTPGPWVVSGVRGRMGSTPILAVYSEAPGPMQDKTHALVLYGDGSAPQHIQAHADARLIASAPDLYEALKDVLRIARAASTGVTGNIARIAKAEAALAKARGEP